MLNPGCAYAYTDAYAYADVGGVYGSRSAAILPVQSPGILTLLFSCDAIAWLIEYYISRKKLSDGKKALSEHNPPHLKYR